MRHLPVLVALAAGTFASVAHAAGFSLIEQSASGMGAAFAGSASQVNDASVQYFNPAGLAELRHPEITGVLHAIDLSLKFTDTGSVLPPAGLGALPRGAVSDDAGGTLLVPNLHLALPLRWGLVAGLSVSSPYGLKTTYDDPWVGRFQGIYSKLETLNVNPALGWRINEFVSIGGGVSWQRATATLTNAVMLGAATEGRARLEVDDSAWGWNAGVLVTPHDTMRVGLGYRSKVGYTLGGDTTVTGPTGAAIAAVSGPTQADIDMPEQGYFSLSQKIGSRFTLLFDASLTRWGRIQSLRALNSATGAARDVLDFGFTDTWRYALGGEYVLGERWTLRAGAARDESPVALGTRTVRLPDADRTWASVGAQYRWSEHFTFDAGFAHIFINDAGIAATRTPQGAPASFTSVVAGEYSSSVNILSAQVRYAFAPL